MDSGQSWDDVIVGAGSAGAVLAARLSEQAGRRVLLLEAGPDFFDEPPDALKDARAPVMSGYHWYFGANLRSSGLFKNILESAGVLAAGKARDVLCAAQAVLGAPRPIADSLQQYPYALGKVVGGSSAVNGALAVRGLKEDFERWAALGNTEWTWEKVLPFYQKIENDHDFPGAAHGAQGLLPITRVKAGELDALQSAFLQACREMGLPELADLNGSSEPGVGPLPCNSIDQVRISSADAYLQPARNRANLRIQSDCAVNRLLFDGLRAVGVELQDAYGASRNVFGKRITLCAGAINSVAILLRSGIGNGRLCRSLGISPMIDLPGVGENLMDHPSVILWMTPKAGLCREGLAYHQIMARVAANANRGSGLNLFMLSNVVTARLPMLRQLLGVPLASGISVLLANPASRGRVFLDSAAPGSKPVIELNLVSAAQDMEALMQGVRLAWKIARAAPLAERTESIFMWTEAMVANDSFLKSAIKRFIGATWHAAGTAKMGAASDPMAVVDQHCRVHGVQNLRVVDASVMPLIPSAATNLSCLMLAERAAAWMKEELT